MTAPPYSPYTGFGDNPATSVKFGILRQNGRLPSWSGGPRLNQFSLRNSDRVITQRDGRDPYEIRMRIWFATMDAYETLDALQGTRATLRYRWGLTKAIGGSHWRGADGVDYLVLPDVLLMSLDAEELVVGSVAEVTATFQRAFAATQPRVYGPYPAPPDPEAS